MSNTFILTPEQEKLCHELTMEFIRQNNVFAKECSGSTKNIGDRVRNVYFDMYEEIAIGIHDNWDKINGELSK